MFVKKCLLALLCGVAVLSLANQSRAIVLESEDFDSYADGSLIIASDPKWVNNSGTLFDSQVLNNASELKNDGSRSEDLHMSWDPNSSDSGRIFFGLDFSVANDPNNVFVSDGEYFAHFGNPSFQFNTRVDIVGPSVSGFSVGIGSDDSTADAQWATDLTFGTTYRLVAGYNQEYNQAEIWIDPVGIASTSVLGDNKPDPGDIASWFNLRQSFSDLQETITVDNINVATTWREAAGIVPEPTSLVLMLVGLAGMLTRRRL